MKICHLTSAHSYNDDRIFLKECRSLAAAGFDVHLIAPASPDKLLDGVKLHGNNVNNNSRFNRISKTMWSIYRKALALDADIYHFHDPELLIIGLLLQGKNKKVIYDAHEDFPRTILTKNWIPKSSRWALSIISEKYENMIAKYLYHIVAATPFICDRFLKLGCNAININNYPVNEELLNLPVNFQTKQKYVCYLGAINEKRGIFEMLAAIDDNDVKLLLAGRFESKSQREQAVATKGWQKVRELGQVDRNGIKEVLQKSMAGLVILYPTPSYIYSLPIKMFEYMASAIPVIASNFPLWEEIVITNKCGICVDPFDVKEIARAIHRIVSDPEEGRRMGENGRRAVIEKYNWENESKKLVSFYQDISS